MKIRNKKTGMEISSPSMKFLSEYQVFSDINLPVFFEKDGWEEAGDEMGFVTKWRKIDRDKDGFATEECLDEMFASIPIVIRDCDNEYYVIGETDDLVGWRGDIEIHPFYTHWMKIPKI
jgi:hypothetical protein